MLEQCCNHSMQCNNNVVTLWCAENCNCETSRETSPINNHSTHIIIWTKETKIETLLTAIFSVPVDSPCIHSSANLLWPGLHIGNVFTSWPFHTERYTVVLMYDRLSGVRTVPLFVVNFFYWYFCPEPFLVFAWIWFRLCYALVNSLFQALR